MFWPLQRLFSLVSEQKYWTQKESIPFIFNDEGTGSCICLRLDLYMSHVKIICASADSFYFSYSHIHPRYPRPQMCIRNAYVSVAVNVPAVTSRHHGTVREISKVTRNKRRLKHIHVKKGKATPSSHAWTDSSRAPGVWSYHNFYKIGICKW
jgi:hypothetical protein